jgi:hypothetical protein
MRIVLPDQVNFLCMALLGLSQRVPSSRNLGSAGDQLLLAYGHFDLEGRYPVCEPLQSITLLLCLGRGPSQSPVWSMMFLTPKGPDSHQLAAISLL